MELLIRAEGLRVRFGTRVALDGLSLQVAAGEVVGLLGPNGAGKTTTLAVLATLRRAEGGTAEVGGFSTATGARSVRRLLGLVPQALAVYPTLTAAENLIFFARVLGLRRAQARAAAERMLELVGLEDRRNDVVATFSGGMQRRLNLACGLLHAPRVVLLDEPTVGVDPQSRERIFAAVRAQAAAGAAVLYSTHYLEEAERLCDRVVLIDHGRLIATGTPAALIQESGVGLRLSVTTREPLPCGWEAELPGIRSVEAAADDARGHAVHLGLDAPAAAARVLERATALGGEVIGFHLQQPSLQDVFIKLTGHELRD
jgi:ABC-2 type transport system ATP-binding protein